MATYQDFSLIKKEVEFVQKRNKIEQVPTAFIFMVLEKLYPEIDPLDYITDGSMDFSIDAYYIDEAKKTINLFQFKHTGSFETAKKKNGIKEKELNDLIVKLEAIWNRDKDLLKRANIKLEEAIQEIWEAFEKGFIKTNIYLITNYQTTLDNDHMTKARQQIKDRFRAELKVLSLDELVKLIIEKEFHPVDIKLQLKGKNYFEESTGDVRALIAEVNALNFLKSVLDKKEEIKEEVFNENVRVYLQSNTKINKQIYNSIEAKENYKFFYYNNGITAVCDSFEHNRSDSPLVTLKNFQIVNGGQTMHSIYEAYKNGLKDKIDNIYLLLRIYEVKNREVGQEIARFTNTQNPVKNRDIMSNDLIQIKLQKELHNEGFYYERKKYEYREQKIDNNNKIDAEKLGQAILTFYLEKPGSAKNKKQEIFGDFYNDIFAEDKINTDYVLLPNFLYKKIEIDIKKFTKKVRKLEKDNKIEDLEKSLHEDGFLSHAHYYLLFVLKLLAENENILLNRGNANKIFEFYNKAKTILRDIVKKKKKDPKFSMPHLFKSDDLVNEIKNSSKIDDPNKTKK
ncbi:AIPR family protein [bacterium]|nr:AIPR family protein [bacterium]